jgi:hypothetical protein
MKFSAFILSIALLAASACSHKTIPARAAATAADTLPVLPVTDINIPVTVNLKPVFAAIEQSLQLEYSSPGWPDEYEQEGCDTRYMYSFHTGGLGIKSIENNISFNFAGLYQLKAMERNCIAAKKTSRWGKPCKCGLDNEEERRANTGFTVALGVQPNYRLNTHISLKEAELLDKCTACNFKKDIPALVINKVKTQMENIRSLFQDKLDSVNLRPAAEKLWNRFSVPQYVNSMGYVNARPAAVRLSPFIITDDTLLNTTAGINMLPEATLHSGSGNTASPLPNIDLTKHPDGFAVYADVKLQYDSLTQLANRYIRGMEYYFKKGIIKKHFVVDSCELYGAAGNTLVIKLFYSGTNRGTAYLFGQPELNVKDNVITLLNPQYDIRTRDITIRLGVALFKKRIKKELLKFASYNFNSYIDTAKNYLTTMLNRNIAKGIFVTGAVNDIKPLYLKAMPGYLFVRVNAAGTAGIKVQSFVVPSPGM